MIAISVILSRLEMPPVVSMSMMENRCLSKLSFLLINIFLFTSSKLFSFDHFKAEIYTKIITGAEQFDQYLTFLRDKRVGLIVNHSSRINGSHLVDTLISLGIKVEKIFAPEHGFRGSVEAGSTIEDGKDEHTGIDVISLYGKKYKPDSADLNGLDIIIYDIQDVGVRFYTYISTLHYVMEGCAEFCIPFMILDRPNPNGHYIDGPILDTSFRSFVGIHPIPVVYGMTVAELARMIKGECWIHNCEQLELQIISCKNYTHSTRVELTINPSPNLTNELSILLYPSLCFFEGTIVSLGRGTPFPFQVFGHPAMNVKENFCFTPISLPIALNPPWKDSLCCGVDLRSLDLERLHESGKINLSYLLMAFNELGKDSTFFLKNNFIDRLAGTDQFRNQILDQQSEFAIRRTWKEGLQDFKLRSRKYLIYK